MESRILAVWCIAFATAVGACNGKTRSNPAGTGGATGGTGASGGSSPAVGGSGGSAASGTGGGGAGRAGTGGSSGTGGGTTDSGKCVPYNQPCATTAQCCRVKSYGDAGVVPLTCHAGGCQYCIPNGQPFTWQEWAEYGCPCCSGFCGSDTSGICACMPSGGGCFQAGPDPDCCSGQCVQTGHDAYRCS
jgi:hypothetical protein